jgi:aminopeptidase
VITHYCLEVQPDQKVMIVQYEIESWPLALATYESVIKAGGYPQIQLKSEYLRRAFMKYGSEEQYGWAPEMEIKSMEWADCYIALRGGYNLDIYHDISADVLAVNQRAHGVASTARWKNTRWSLTRVPNAAFAQQAGLDLEPVTDMYFNACLLDYSKALYKRIGWAKELEGTNRGALEWQEDQSAYVKKREVMGHTNRNIQPARCRNRHFPTSSHGKWLHLF